MYSICEGRNVIIKVNKPFEMKDTTYVVSDVIIDTHTGTVRANLYKAKGLHSKELVTPAAMLISELVAACNRLAGDKPTLRVHLTAAKSDREAIVSERIRGWKL